MQFDKQGACYDVAGPPHAFPMLLVHGAAWTRSMWLPQMQALSDTFRTIAIDLPGHGVRRGEPFQLNSTLKLIEETLKQETEEPALIVGLSLGGYVAMAYAHAHPHDVAGLVLSGCSMDYRGAIGWLSRLDSLLVTTFVSERRLSEMQAKTLRSMFPESVVKPQLNAGFSWNVLPQVYRELSRHHWSTLLQTYAGPVLILNGDHDKLNRKREAVLLRAAHHGELHVITGASHLCNLEQAETFTEHVRLFAQRLSISA